MIGKLKSYLKERCPDCGKVLQHRILEVETVEKGLSIIASKEIICCSDIDCGYQRNIEKKRIRRSEEI